MKPLEFFSVAKAQQVTTHPAGICKLEATPNAGTGTALYVQLHDTNQTPADGAVPLKSWPIAEIPYKEFEHGELHVTSGLYLCLSTTAGTKTLTTLASDILDILQVELTDPEIPTGTTVVGDTTTQVSSLQVWADASGPKKLISVEINATGLSQECWLMLFANDNPSAGAPPVVGGIIPLPYLNGAGPNWTGNNKLFFGVTGRDLFFVDANGNHAGCTLALSTTPGTLTPPAGGNTVTLKAEYK